jgi:coenzyme F420-reducing hydrogenase alpha subunit
VGRSGTASAEAARGRLEHRIVLGADGLVVAYAIAAPTSSHFGDGGIAARSLSALSARTREELAAQADLLIRTIDPCVGYEVRFS